MHNSIPVVARDLVPRRCTLGGEEARWPSIPSVSVTLDDSQQHAWAWLVTVYAEIVVGKLVYLGQMLTYPVSHAGERSRCILQASCPGAKRWTVEIVRSTEPDIGMAAGEENARATLVVAACPDLLVPGLAVLPMSGVVVGERVGFYSDDVAAGNSTFALTAALPVDRQKRIVKLSVFQDGTGAQVQLDCPWLPGGLTLPVTLPPNGANTWDFGVGTLLPMTLRFLTFPANGGAWAVEYRW